MTLAYYNEHDPMAAAWLRELIADGLIAPGVVDSRDIRDVQPSDLHGYTQCHFFAGVGGWSVALRLAGWSDDRPVWTGSCPCQPFSSAGKRKGVSDERHLWPDFMRLIDACRPAVVFGEQVASSEVVGKVGAKPVEDAPAWIERVCADLEAADYATGFAVLGAHSAGSPHIRQRLYWLADGNGERFSRRPEPDLQPIGSGFETPPGNHAGGRSGHGGLADAELQPAGQRVAGVEGHARQWRDRPAIDGVTGGLEHAPSDGRQQRRAESGGRGTASGCGDGRLENPDSMHTEQLARGGPGAEREDGEGSHREPAGRSASFWSASRWHLCRDGKARRVPLEPSLFPLAHGTPGRVGVLRGAGNAIVPQVAAAFIQAAEGSVNP